MNRLDKFEHFFERVMEESVGRIFRSPIQPAEIGRRLERAMESNQVVSVDGIIVPNDYKVEMNPQDMVIFADFVPVLCRQMEEWLIDLANTRSYGFIDHVRVQIAGDENVNRRQIFVESDIKELPNFSQAEQDEIQKTEVMRIVQTTGNIPPKLLKFIEGDYVGSTIIVRRPLLQIGRSLDNDIVLESAEVSRHHARLEYRGESFHILDLGSTNGTSLNGRPVSDSALSHGDRITFGNITLEFLPYATKTTPNPSGAAN
ncbi:DUF3662 and FHA domain-containing protein [soil metagenome]|nr:DUF3662 domain-containing protein [Chloroflexia bacterium]